MENEVLRSWDENAAEWINILDTKEIPSRKFTDKAIVHLLTELPVSKILDCGCGEGWLTRSMTKIGKKSVGIDATLKLIKNAKSRGSESFYQLSYEDVIAGKSIPESPFDAAVFNFSLYQKNGLVKLLKNIIITISKNGYIIIQTLHPFFLRDQRLKYEPQWILNSWKGLPGDFKNGHSWYARTFENWVSVFTKSGLLIHKMIEVSNDKGSLASVIFVLKKVL